jgi:hypothetical protein
MATESDPSAPGVPARRRRLDPPALSLPAILGTLVLVAGAVAFGVLGPRMGQRGMRLRGIPATRLQDAVIGEIFGDLTRGTHADVIQAEALGDPDPQRVMRVAIRDLEEVLGPAVEPPGLSEAGFELVGSRRLDLLQVPAVRLDYRSEETGRTLVLIELADPLAFVHFDTLGRQLPLLPGTRIEEAIPLDPSGRILPPVGMVMLGFDGRATVIVTIDPDVAGEVADLIEPVIPADSSSAVEGVATILEGPLEPMTRS